MANKKIEEKEVNEVKKTPAKKKTAKEVPAKKAAAKKSTKKTSSKKVTPKKEVKEEVKNTEVLEVVNEEMNENEESIHETQEEPKTVEIKEEVKCKKGKVKKFFVRLLIYILALLVVGAIVYFFVFKDTDKKPGKNPEKPNPTNKLPKLPKPEVTEGERGLLGIDKNINEKVIDKYLGREDAVYRDMRLLEDPAEYESIGGDRYLSGYIKGFEVVPLPYIIPVTNLPEEVGDTYVGDTLFFKNSDGTYEAMYKESWDIINELFPKDKVIFLMCGGGGYAGMMKEFLIANGWDKDKIYNIGGYWYYEGKNNIIVPKTGTSDKPKYDFSKVPYHEIDFTELTEVKYDLHKKGDISKITLEDEYYGGKDEKFETLLNKLNSAPDEWDKTHKEYKYEEYAKYEEKLTQDVADYLNKLMKDKKSFVITIWSYYGCGDDDDTLRTKAINFFDDNNIYYYDIGNNVLEKTDFAKYDIYSPNVIMIKNGKVYTYYDNESDADLKISESQKSVNEWLKKYIVIK